MKTQDFGWSLPVPAVPQGYVMAISPSMRGWSSVDARGNYQGNRSNGGDEDSPARDIPLDGKCSDWVKCPDKDTLPSPLADGTYKQDWEDGDHDSWYRIRYEEGPGDKAWMQDRDGNYLARLEREDQVDKAARLRASLPASHPHYRALNLVVPASGPLTRQLTPHLSGQEAGAGAAAPSPTPPITPLPPAAGASMAADHLAKAFELQAAGDHRQAIRLLDDYLGEHPSAARAHKFRGFSKMKLSTSTSSISRKHALLESAKADYLFVLGADPTDNETSDAIDIIDQQLASTPLAAAGAGAGAGASPAPAVTLFHAVDRVWTGKYATGGSQPIYVPHAKKTEGSAIGAIYRKTPSKPGASHPGKLWLGKVGFNQSERVERALRTHSLVRRAGSVDSIREKVAADTYALLSRGHYLLPKHRLAKLPVINEFTRENVLAQTLVEEMNCGQTERTDTAVHLMSKWIDGYQNLDTAQIKYPDGNIGPIMAYIEAQHTLPERIVIDGREVPLLGMMEILAAARLLGDTDALGGGGKSAGYVIERNSYGTPVAARAVKIDAGNAFNFHGADNRLSQSFNPMASAASRSASQVDIQFGNRQSFDIEWAKLTEGQRSTFLDAMQNGLQVLRTPSAMRILINREGEFNRAKAGLLTESVVTSLTKVWQANVTMHASDRLYGPMLAEPGAVVSPSP